MLLRRKNVLEIDVVVSVTCGTSHGGENQNCHVPTQSSVLDAPFTVLDHKGLYSLPTRFHDVSSQVVDVDPTCVRLCGPPLSWCIST